LHLAGQITLCENPSTQFSNLSLRNLRFAAQRGCARATSRKKIDHGVIIPGVDSTM
jgi:hypothetical protein